MPKKKWTPEERKAFAEKMKAARAKKTPEIKQSEKEAAVSNETVEALLKRIEELEKGSFFQRTPEAVKAITKFSINQSDYPDPRTRLADEPRLAQHAFKQNFALEWAVGRAQYQKDGINYTEPKFEIELWRWLTDGATGELTNKKYRIQKAVFFEDPDAAVQCAQDKGLPVDASNEQAFLNEMRYLRIRDWLFEVFWPAPMKSNDSNREEIVGNRLVPVVEVSSYQEQDVLSKLV
jgi:hypothetical protein